MFIDILGFWYVFMVTLKISSYLWDRLAIPKSSQVKLPEQKTCLSGNWKAWDRQDLVFSEKRYQNLYTLW